jgi:hypothetical protein
MTGDLAMTDNDHMLAIIESAERSTPHCPICGDHTAPVAHEDGSLWLECTSRVKPTLLRRLLTLDFIGGHTRRQILDAA